MLNPPVIAGMVLSAFFVGPAHAAPENTKAAEAVEATEPGGRHAITFEVGGRSFFGFNYDTAVSDIVSLGGGLGFLPGLGSNSTVLFIPLYSNFYLSTSPVRFYGSAGFTLVTATFRSADFGSVLIPTVGFGFEASPGKGFLFRISPYAVISTAGVFPWASLAIGVRL